MKLRIVPVIIFIILSSLIASCRPKAENEKAQPAIPVKVFKAELKNLEESLEYVGNIRAQDEAVVYPKVSGKIIEKVKEDNSPINKGEAIAYIDRDEVGLKFEKAPVESPITGIIGRIYVDIGSNVSTQTPVALVVNMDKVKINLEVPEKYLPQVSIGKPAKIRVDAYPQEEFMGQVTKFSPVIDLATRTAPVEIMVDNPGHLLKSGMFAKINLILDEHKDALVILKEAVIGKEPETYVYVIKESRAFLTKVILGIRQGPYFEVKEGLKAGDSVVIVGQQRLRDNAQVTVEEVTSNQ